MYAKASTRMLLGSRYTNGAGDTAPIPGYRELTTSIGGEIGLGADLTLLLHWDVARRFSIAGGGRGAWWRPGDAHVGLRLTALRFGRGALSVEGVLGVPFASDDAIAPLLDDDGAKLADLRAGPGVFDAAGRVEVGWAWDRTWTSAAAGWVQRFGGYDGQIDWRAEIGTRWWRLHGVLRLGGRHTIDTANAARLENPSGQTNGTSYSSTIFELGASPVDGVVVGGSAQLSMAGLGVRSQARGPVFTMFLSYRR